MGIKAAFHGASSGQMPRCVKTEMPTEFYSCTHAPRPPLATLKRSRLAEEESITLPRRPSVSQIKGQDRRGGKYSSSRKARRSGWVGNSAFSDEGTSLQKSLARGCDAGALTLSVSLRIRSCSRFSFLAIWVAMFHYFPTTRFLPPLAQARSACGAWRRCLQPPRN